MGWDVALNRKLAVPLALDRLWESHENLMTRSRTLRESMDDHEEMRMLMKLADNRVRLEKLMEDIEGETELADSDELQGELDYVNASVQLGLLEITGELEEIQGSEEIFEEALA